MTPADFEHVEFDPDEFSGKVRMFPIPNLVMFPHVVQPLHIFEERYREMMQDALAGDRLIAMPVLKPGWEPDYASRPPLEPWACLGKVVLHNELPDGCFNLLLMGVARIKLGDEHPPLRSFRQADATLIHDQPLSGDSVASAQLQQQLIDVFDDRVTSGQAPQSIKPLLENGLPLAQLTDLVAYAVPLAAEQKLQLLAESSPDRRARQLLGMLSKVPKNGLHHALASGFPPPFSVN